MEKESFLQWFSSEIPETLFPQIAAQVLFRARIAGNAAEGKATHWLMRRICKRLPERLPLAHPRRGPGLRILTRKKILDAGS